MEKASQQLGGFLLPGGGQRKRQYPSHISETGGLMKEDMREELLDGAMSI